MYAKICFVILPLWIWKPRFGSSFSTLSNWFNISPSKNAREIGPYIWRPPERDCIYFMQLTTFITQNQHICITKRCAPCRMAMGKDEFRSSTVKGFFALRCSDRSWDGVWSDHRAGIGTPKNGFWWAYTRVWNYRGPSVDVCLAILYTTMYPSWKVQWQKKSSGQHGEEWRHKDLRPVQQADLWQFIWRLEAHLLLYEHYGGDLDSLSSGISGELSQCRGSKAAAPTADGKSAAAFKNENGG